MGRTIYSTLISEQTGRDLNTRLDALCTNQLEEDLVRHVCMRGDFSATIRTQLRNQSNERTLTPLTAEGRMLLEALTAYDKWRGEIMIIHIAQRTNKVLVRQEDDSADRADALLNGLDQGFGKALQALADCTLLSVLGGVSDQALYQWELTHDAPPQQVASAAQAMIEQTVADLSKKLRTVYGVVE